MAYTGALDPLTGTTTTNTLSRDVHIETLESFTRATVFRNLVYVQTIQTGSAGQFIVNGKASDSTNPATYARGTQVSITDAEMDERTITLARPIYEAKRVDKFEEKVAHYDVRGMITSQMGESLANKYDKTIAALLLGDVTTGVASNPDEHAAIEIANDTNKGDSIAAAIFTAKAHLEENDDMGEAYCVLSPMNYALLVQSGKAVNADYTSGNGGFDSGTVMDIAGVKIFKSNNITGGVAGSVGVVFTRQAVGVLESIGLQTNQETQIDFLDATLMTAYYSIGAGILRPESKVVLLDAV